jgi:hypothetical protein
MPKPPAINAQHLGAAIDALCTTNALMFMLLASREQSDAALRLLDGLASEMSSKDGMHEIRADVAQHTADSIRRFRALSEGKRPTAGEGKN